MNIIFLDFDGVLNTHHHIDDKVFLENKIKILSDMCHMYDAKIVIEASAKSVIDEDTLETTEEWIQEIFDLFKKYNIEVIGRTPNVIRHLSDYSSIDMWKEDEIKLYLFRHPEIEHYCIIDDNDFKDLEKVKDHLVETIDSSDNHDEEGLLEIHKEEVGKILKKDNEIRRLLLKYKH